MTIQPTRHRSINFLWIVLACCLCTACRPSEISSQDSATQREAMVAMSSQVAERPEQTGAGSSLAAAPEASQSVDTPVSTKESIHSGSSNHTPLAEVTRSDHKPQDEIDPHRDGWDTEVLSDKVSGLLNELSKLLVGESSESRQVVDRIAAEDIHGGPLFPRDLEVVFQDKTLQVRSGLPREGYSDGPDFQGPAEFHQALQDYAARWKGVTDVHVKFKLFRVLPDDAVLHTISYVEVIGLMEEGSRQHNTTWHCDWRLHEGADPQLVALEMDNFSEAVVHSDLQTWFSDCTLALLGDLSAYQQQLQFGIDYWRARLEAYFGIYFDGHHGLAIGDVNGDLLDDVYICEPGGLPNRLFVQTASGQLNDISAEAGVDFLEYSRAALFADLDNDGDQDLLIPVTDWIFFLANDGQGHFQQRQKVPMTAQTAYSICAADIDGDGDVDVYTCSYHGADTEETNRLPSPLPYHDARSGGKNHLYRNEGAWNFEDATDEVGLGENNDRWSFAAAFEDYDNDGDQDLYVANDFGRNNLYRNDSGKFSDVAAAANAEDTNFGMSATFGDYNRDGWMDLYVSNMFSSAGGRITFQSRFQKDADDEVKRIYQQLARGNTLLENHKGTFEDVSIASNVTMGRWAWGSLFADVNNDGWEDLLVANGYVTGQFPDDL